MANTHSIDLEQASSQYLSITDAAQTGLDITGDLTIEAWVKFETLTNDEYRMIVDKWISVGQRSYRFAAYAQAAAPTRTLYFFVSSTGSGGSIATSVATGFTTGTWYHVAMVYDAAAASVEFFVDGSSIGSVGSLQTSIYNGTAPVSIGSGPAGENFYDGLIDEVRIWNDKRTAAEILNNKNTELTGSEANLQGYWKFNNNYLDETANNNDLTASGAPVFSTDIPAWAQVYTQTQTEVIALVDTISRIEWSIRQTLTNIITLVDSGVSILVRYYHSLVDSVILNDILTAGKILTQTISDTLNLSDTISRIEQGFRKTIEDIITLVDVRSIVGDFRKTISEIIALVDSITISARDFRTTLTESLTLNAVIHIPGTWWNWIKKNIASWTHPAKNTATWTHQTKNTSTWDFQDKSDI